MRVVFGRSLPSADSTVRALRTSASNFECLAVGGPVSLITDATLKYPWKDGLYEM
jgi:hypothetical protein